MTLRVRIATEDDAAQIVAIYGESVRGTPISFELKVPDVEEMQRRIADALENGAWLVGERDGLITGYAYAGPHRKRAAYQWAVEVSVYVDSRARRTGVGRILDKSLLSLLTTQGFYVAYAGVTLPNAASVSLHEDLGFKYLGTYQSVGYKLGKWHDVGWWELTLRERDGEPIAPRRLGELTEAEIERDLAN